MELSSALANSYGELRRHAELILANDTENAHYALNELNIAISAQNVATQRALRLAKIPENSRLQDLFESIERESRQIAVVARQLAKKAHAHPKGARIKKEINELSTHLKHHLVKGKYIEEHLGDFLTQEEMGKLGDEFLSEFETISKQMRKMDFEADHYFNE